VEDAGFDPTHNLNDLEALSDSIEKMKDRLASYRKNSLQSSLDKEEMEKELNLAKDIEMGMVPTKYPLFPGRSDIDCYGRLIQAKIVGGDLFDIFLIDDNHLFISICDTLGKGIPAAIFSVVTRTYIRSIANPITRLGKMMEVLNDGLCLGRESDMFATVLLGKLNLQTGEFVYCNAGHPHPIILRNDNQEEVLTQSHGIPVGVRNNQKFLESKIVLAPGELLITYTDGVTEESNEQGDFFGIERLIDVVKPLRTLSTENIVNKTLNVLERFRGRAEVHDDTTLVALKFTRK
jgi:sigma-B regulation protein RsbU (phosphoserine phosphatase)